MDMERSAKEVRVEIDDIRDGLGDTLEAIGDRVAPKKVIARAKADLTDKVDDVKAKAKASPSALARRSADTMRRGLHNAVGGDGSTSLGQAAKGKGRVLASQANSSVSSVAETVSDAPQVARQKARGNPLAAGLLAAASGFFIAALLPATEKERELNEKAKQKLQPLVSEAVEAGKSMAGDLKSSAQEGLETVKDKVSDAAQEVQGQAGSSVRTVKEETTEATQTVSEQTKTAAGRVKKQATGAASVVKSETNKAATTAKTRAR